MSFPPLSRCAVYTRQSRTTGGDFSSCDAQFDACFQFIRSQAGLGWFYCNLRYDDEGVTGESLDRPGLARLWTDLKADRIDRLVIHRLDRLSRKVAHCSSMLDQLRERQVALTIVNSPELGATATDALMLNLLATFAEFEKAITGERMADARAALKRRGKRVAGAVPFGYSTDPATKQLIPDRAEARRVVAIFERAAKGETPKQIAAHANRYGWRTKCHSSDAPRGGNRWTPRQVLATLSNPVYLGMIHDGKQTRPGDHRPLVTQQLYDQAAAQIASRRTQTKSRSDGRAVSWPLRGRISCAACGRAMSPSVSGYRNFSYRYYRCRSHAGGRPPCPGVSAPAEEIERLVCQMLGDARPAEILGECSDYQLFAAAWTALGDYAQRRILPQVISQVAFDARHGAVSITLTPGASEAARTIAQQQ